MTPSQAADLIGRALHERHMRAPSIRLLLDAVPALTIKDVVDGVALLNQGGAGIALTDCGVWTRMVNRREGWYWVRAHSNRCVGPQAGKGEWTPMRWFTYAGRLGVGSWRAGGLAAPQGRFRPDGNGYFEPTEFEMEIIETPISVPAD